MFPNKFSAYGVNFDSRMLDKIFYVVDKSDMSQKLLFYHTSHS